MWQLQTSDYALKQFFSFVKECPAFDFKNILSSWEFCGIRLQETLCWIWQKLVMYCGWAVACARYMPLFLSLLKCFFPWGSPHRAPDLFTAGGEKVWRFYWCQICLKFHVWFMWSTGDLVGGVDSCLQDGDNITMTKVGRLQFKKPNKYWVEGSQKRVSCLLSILWHGRFELVSTNHFAWVVFKQ